MNRREIGQIIKGAIRSDSNNEDILNHLNVVLDKLKLAMDKNISNIVLDKKTKEPFFDLDHNDDLSSSINELAAGNFYLSLTHLNDLVLRHYCNEQVAPFEIFIYGSIIQSMIAAIQQL